MAISVDPMAFVDVRFDALAKALRCGRDSALVRMMRVWHMCTELETDRLSTALLGSALRCKPDRVAGILEAVELGELVDGDLVRVRGTNEKRTGWKATQRERSEAAASSWRARDLEAEILASVSQRPAASRNELVSRLRARRANVYRAFARLWDSGTLVRGENGGIVPRVGSGNSSGNKREQFREQAVPLPPTPTPTPRNTLAGVPAPARERPEQGTGNREQGTQNVVGTSTDGQQPAHPQPPPDRYTRLYDAWCEVVAQAGANVRVPGPLAGRATVHQALSAPELAGVTDAEVEHGLSMLGVQARALDQAGEQDPWWLLSSSWSPRVLRAAIDVPDAQTARARALRRNRSGNKGASKITSAPSSYEGDST